MPCAPGVRPRQPIHAKAKYCVFEVRVGLLLADGVCGGRPGDATVHIQPAGGVHGVLGGAHGQADGDHVLVVAVDAGPPDRKAPLAGRALVAQPAQRVAGAVLVFGVDVGELGAKAHVNGGELGPVPLLVVQQPQRQGALGGLGDRSGHGPMMPCGRLSAPTAASGRFADGSAARPQDPLAGPPERLAAQAAQTHRAGAHRRAGGGATRPDRASGFGGAGHRAHRPPAWGAAGHGAQVAAALVPAGPGGAWGSAPPWPAAGLPLRGGRRGQGVGLRAAGHPRRAAEPLESWRAAPGGHRRRAGEAVSAATLWRWLHADVLKPWRHHAWIFPRDPEFAAKAGRVLDLYQGVFEGVALQPGEYVISADEKTSIQARRRRHASLPAGRGRAMRVEHEYDRGGALAYLAAWDVHHARVFGRCEPSTGIRPFDRLAVHVLTVEPYASAVRVFCE